MNMEETAHRIRPCADDYVTVFESPDPQSVYCYSPAIINLPGGRLVLTMDLGGKGVPDLPGPKGSRKGFITQGKCLSRTTKGVLGDIRMTSLYACTPLSGRRSTLHSRALRQSDDHPIR